MHDALRGRGRLAQPGRHLGEQHAEVDRLDDVVERAAVQRAELLHLAGVHGLEHHAERARTLDPELFVQRMPVEARQVDVEEHQGPLPALGTQTEEAGQRVGAVGVRLDVIPGRAEGLDNNVGERAVVFDEHDVRHIVGLGAPVRGRQRHFDPLRVDRRWPG
jgi:hypothetical protein